MNDLLSERAAPALDEAVRVAASTAWTTGSMAWSG
jgi:hypothetical protein